MDCAGEREALGEGGQLAQEGCGRGRARVGAGQGGESGGHARGGCEGGGRRQGEEVGEGGGDAARVAVEAVDEEGGRGGLGCDEGEGRGEDCKETGDRGVGEREPEVGVRTGELEEGGVRGVGRG